MIANALLHGWIAVGCRAPSPHNNQPWSVELGQDELRLRLDPRYLPRLGPDRLQFMALGAFVENISYAAEAAGYAMRIGPLPVVPKRDVEIVLTFDGATSPADAQIRLDAAQRRRTNRGAYLLELPAGALDSLDAIAAEDGTSVTFLGDADAREITAGLAARAMEIVFTLPEMRADLAPYVFTPVDAPTDVGMALSSMNSSADLDVTGRRWALELADPAEEAAAARSRFEAAPLHFVVAARTDTLPGWIAAGRTLQRVLVAATSIGLAHCLAAGASEVPTLLASLRPLLGDDAGRPMLLGRLGVPADPEASVSAPRRDVANVVIGQGA